MEQKEEERLVLNYFRKYFDDFPKGKVIRNESPDFIVRKNANVAVGIELTRLPGISSNLYDDLSASIMKKNGKLELYHHILLNEIWLIVYKDDLTSYQNGNIQNLLANRSFKTGFNFIFLFDLYESKIYRLNIEKGMFR